MLFPPSQHLSQAKAQNLSFPFGTLSLNCLSKSRLVSGDVNSDYVIFDNQVSGIIGQNLGLLSPLKLRQSLEETESWL